MLISVSLAQTAEDKRTADDIVSRHHSYVPSTKVVGRCLKYLCLADGAPVGTIWIGSFMKPTPKDILRRIGVPQKQLDVCFNNFADNKKFCMAVALPNAGTQILRCVRQRVADDWRDTYGDNLVALFTTIGGGKNGAVYRADNWEVVGHTAGLPKGRKSTSMKWDDSAVIKDRFVKPTGEDKKIILGTARLGGRKADLASVRGTLGLDLL